MSRKASTRLALGIAVAALAVAGCGNDDEASGGGSTEARTVETEQSSAVDLSAEVAPYRKPESREPEPDIPVAPAPRELEVKDMREGTGPEIEEGDEAIVNYVGYHYANRRQYDTSYGTERIPYKVTPGAGDFIKGFEQGIVGMRLNGRRQVTIPSRLAYGRRGYNDQIRPGETLVFVVDVEALEKH